MIDTFMHKKKQIEVPLNHPFYPDEARNELEKQWALIVHYKRASRDIEEVYAVRSSLLEALKIGLIEDDESLQQIKTAYRNVYGKDYPFFTLIYDALDFVAGKIGENAATGMIHYVFEMLSPTLAFLEILSDMCEVIRRDPDEFLWSKPDDATAYLTKLSVDQARSFFSKAYEGYSPSCDTRTDVLDLVEEIKQAGDIFCGQRKDIDDFGKLLFGSSISFVVTAYDDFIFPFSLLELKYDELKDVGVIIDEFEYGDIALVLEAIMQQLTTGIGLLCPFWMEHPAIPPTCCGNRELFEKVWECTSPTSSCKRWERLGCLAKVPVVQGQRKRLITSGIKAELR